MVDQRCVFGIRHLVGRKTDQYGPVPPLSSQWGQRLTRPKARGVYLKPLDYNQLSWFQGSSSGGDLTPPGSRLPSKLISSDQ
ncbi:hypothetical protein RRG08_017565 [Elysia crispata]|uniref:Uncharacterized protein n=1 Tax=Elysia crispata TaxID=231223 RepID=A0AAE1AYN5_9GAST|nr:hypothetical protein RRG08_017565 [Elysia crispata]